MVNFDVEKIKRHIPNLDASNHSQDNTLKQYWANGKHYYDNKAAVHTAIPQDYYDEDAYDMWEKYAAAEWIYWNSPTHPLNGVEHVQKLIDTHLLAKFHKRTAGTSNVQIGKANSGITGTTGL